jgi:hypothetical protein
VRLIIIAVGVRVETDVGSSACNPRPVPFRSRSSLQDVNASWRSFDELAIYDERDGCVGLLTTLNGVTAI